jgi:hypothetical protein
LLLHGIPWAGRLKTATISEVLRHVPAVVCLAALLSPASAAAAARLAFDREVATPGETVVVTGIEAPAGVVGTPALTVYLVRLDLVADLLGEDGAPVQREPEPGEGVVLLGVLEPDADSLGRLSFSVPELEPGRYTTGVWCVSCGGTFEASYRPGVTPPGERGLVLQVVAEDSADDDGGSTLGTAARAILIVVAVLAVVVVLYVVVTNRRKRQSVLR